MFGYEYIQNIWSSWKKIIRMDGCAEKIRVMLLE